MFNKGVQNIQNQDTLFKKGIVFTWEIFKIVVIALAIVIPVRYFLIQPFYVKGASMEPNFKDQEYLIIDEITYRFNEPRRGDVIVFRYPLNRREYFIKRVIGLPGERIKIADGKVIIYNNEHPNGLELKESYLDPQKKIIGSADEKLSAEEYYLLGDNRSDSLDSRFFGAVSKSYIIGRVIFRGWPLDKFGLLLESPKYD